MPNSNPWYICEGCLLIGKEKIFVKEDGQVCPECNSEDIFSLRFFQCRRCRRISEQDDFFEEADRDTEPRRRDMGICSSCECNWIVKIKVDRRQILRALRRSRSQQIKDSRLNPHFSRPA